MTIAHTLSLGSLFSGIGGFDLGFQRAGMACKWQVETDDYATRILEKHWPDVARYRDVRECGAGNLEPVDVVCGGFPCQDVSVAGKRAGLAGERSGLWFEFHRVLAELEPRWVVIENVPGLLSSNRGRDFAAILSGLAELGYLSAWRVLDAQYFGVPQRRRRVFLVGCLGDGRAAEVLFEREGGAWDSAPSREAREDVAGTLGNRIGRGHTELDGHGAYVPFAQNQRDEVRTMDVVGALPAQPGMRQQSYVAFEPRFARNGRGAPGTVVPPLKAQSGRTGKGDSAPCVALRETAQTLTKCYGKNPANSYSDCTPNWALGRYGVRRLTPQECERLQGFPDDHTRYAADGSELSDSARYRMLGNAVAVPCAEWIGKRIVAAESEVA